MQPEVSTYVPSRKTPGLILVFLLHYLHKILHHTPWECLVTVTDHGNLEVGTNCANASFG